TMTRNAPMTATNAHISILGHITEEELLQELSDVETANGFANRFIWLPVRRSKYLPDPEPFQGEVVVGLTRKLPLALVRARQVGRMEPTPAAAELWGHL